MVALVESEQCLKEFRLRVTRKLNLHLGKCNLRVLDLALSYQRVDERAVGIQVRWIAINGFCIGDQCRIDISKALGLNVAKRPPGVRMFWRCNQKLLQKSDSGGMVP